MGCYQDQGEFPNWEGGRGEGQHDRQGSPFSEEITFLEKDKNRIKTALLHQFWFMLKLVMRKKGRLSLVFLNGLKTEFRFPRTLSYLCGYSPCDKKHKTHW